MDHVYNNDGGGARPRVGTFTGGHKTTCKNVISKLFH